MTESSVAPTSMSVEQLFAEIRQIHEQYKQEVPKRRRPWPTSIQSRILELWKLGISTHQIAESTQLPAQTMYSWRQRLKKSEPGFLPVPIVKKRRRRSDLGVVARNPELSLSQLESQTTMLAIVTRDGVRIEGVPINQLSRLIRELSQS